MKESFAMRKPYLETPYSPYLLSPNSSYFKTNPINPRSAQVFRTTRLNSFSYPGVFELPGKKKLSGSHVCTGEIASSAWESRKWGHGKGVINRDWSPRTGQVPWRTIQWTFHPRNFFVAVTGSKSGVIFQSGTHNWCEQRRLSGG